MRPACKPLSLVQGQLLAFLGKFSSALACVALSYRVIPVSFPYSHLRHSYSDSGYQDNKDRPCMSLPNTSQGGISQVSTLEEIFLPNDQASEDALSYYFRNLVYPWWLRWYRVCPQYGRPGFNLWVGKIPREGNGNPLQYYCLENPMDRGTW